MDKLTSNNTHTTTHRGVAYVNLDLGQLGLIDQCAGPKAPVLFGNTHQCASRLKRSQVSIYCFVRSPLFQSECD